MDFMKLFNEIYYLRIYYLLLMYYFMIYSTFGS